MAALRARCWYSDSATRPSTITCRLPDRRRTKSRMDKAGAAKRDWLMSQITRAPALMKGLRGRPRSNSSCTRELNGCPEGSWPRRSQIASPE
ncbi:hypothetical protein PBOI14_40550 [Pseudomonas sp. Boi14]|nr:hypothetical protein PBOI14_40550 [Pseudomonas sp. Boi14]